MRQLIEKTVEKAAERLVDAGLSTMRSCIDAESNMQLLKGILQRLSCRASDIEEKLKAALLPGKKKRKREVDNWLDEVRKMETESNVLQTKVADGFLSYALSQGHIGKMQDQVKELIKQSHHFKELVVDDFESGEPCPPTKLVGQKTQQNLERIWPCLVADNISNIGIYGMGGVGKTTLARYIKYHLGKSNYQVFWVTVTQEFSIYSLQDKIANVLGRSLSNKDEEEVRASLLRGAMREKEKLVLILDDVWDDFCVERIGISLGASNCRLILTTRSLDLCNRMFCQRVFEVKTLNRNESWELFQYTLGPGRMLAEDVEEIAKSVSKECAGLPLGIITVAGSMRGVSEVHEWRNALEELKELEHDEMERYVFPILEWSYNRLNICQKRCFLYCSLFPEDLEIPKTKLIDLFIGAELMKKRDTRKSEFDQGQTILNKLIRSCLLEETSDYHGRPCVKMHDLIRDMAIGMTSGKSSTRQRTEDMPTPRFLVKSKRVEQKEWMEDLNAVSIWGLKVEIPPDMSPTCPNISTLFLPHANIRTFPDSLFGRMCGLKVLNLSYCFHLRKLPNCVSEMVNLTALLLRRCLRLRSVPPLGKLKKLRQLDLSYTGIKGIPQGLEELVSLECLYMERSKKLKKKIPKGTFSKLHRLEQLVLPMSVQLSDSELLKQLEVFSGCLSFTDICKPFIISRLPRYDSLTFTNLSAEYFSDGYGRVGDRDAYREGKTLFFSQCNSCRVLDVLASPRGLLQNLKQLFICELPNLVRVFDWEPEAFIPPGIFSSLTHMKISGCDKLKKLFPVRLLQNLEKIVYLGVDCCSELEEIAADDDEAVESNITVTLPNLNHLYVGFLPRLKNICKPTIIFNSLQSIEVKKCPTLKRLPLFLPTINAPRNSITIFTEEEWWDSLDWDSPNSKQVLNPYFGPHGFIEW